MQNLTKISPPNFDYFTQTFDRNQRSTIVFRLVWFQYSVDFSVNNSQHTFKKAF